MSQTFAQIMLNVAPSCHLLRRNTTSQMEQGKEEQEEEEEEQGEKVDQRQ